MRPTLRHRSESISYESLMLRTLLWAALAVAVSSCTGNRLSVRELAVTPPSLMIAKKNPRTLVLVLDPAKVPAEVPVLVGGADHGGKLTDVTEFVRRDLKKAFSAFFDDVRVMAPGEAGAPQTCVVADVKIDRVEVLVAGSRPDGVLTQYAGSAAITWGFALRPSEASDYLYSFAGESVGSPGEDPALVFRSMFERAITDLLKGYTEKQIHQRLLELPPPATTAPAAATTM